MIVRAYGDKAALTVPLNPALLGKLRGMPGRAKWQGNDLIFDPIPEALAHLQAIPGIEWAPEMRPLLDAADYAGLHKEPPATPETDFRFKTMPYAHQMRVFLASRDKRAFAFLMEQGTGKTKPLLDTAAYLWSQGKIDALLVIAPNGVHRNWVDNEIPAHLPEWTEYRAAYWKAPSTASKAHQQAWDAAANHGPGLAILAVNVEALSHKGAFEEIRAWARRRKVLCVVDESNDIDNTKAKRTKNVIKIGEQALYRRIATGTPVGERPLDLYAQFAFLGPGMLGFQDFESFKRTYAKLEVVHGVEGWRWGVDPETGRLAKIKAPVERVVGFRDLNDLSERIAPHSFRVLKRDCLDLPDKVYAKWPVELTPEQATHYRELKNQLWTEVKGKLIAAPRAITLLLRFQQLTGGYPEAVPLDNNPRLHALAEYARALPGFFIVWAHFRAELEGIAQTLRDALRGWEIVLYHGGIPQEQRARAVKAFQDGTARVFVGNPAAAGRGLTLTNADQVAYYSNSFSLTERLQSEDRAHRIGQKNNVTYTDFYAPGTIDEKVLDALRNKKALADVVTGDEIMQWI